MIKSVNFWRNFNQFDLFPPRSTVTVKKLLGDWSPVGANKTERSGPFVGRRGRSKR